MHDPSSTPSPASPAVASSPLLLTGTDLAATLLAEARRRAAAVAHRRNRPPCLATVLIGEDPSSRTYVAMKRRRCHEYGIETVEVELPATVSTSDAVGAVAALSADPQVDGILVQHPAPDQVDERAVFEAIAPGKDVDGVTLGSFATTTFGVPGFVPCTPSAIVRLLDHYELDPAGMHAVVIGRSPILGRPTAALLTGRDATVTLCHSRTVDLPCLVADADLVIAAVGRPEFVRGDWIKPGAIVVDAGYHSGGRGDVAFEEVAPRCSAITPVPGGVGPMTIAVLLTQTVAAAEHAVVAQTTC